MKTQRVLKLMSGLALVFSQAAWSQGLRTSQDAPAPAPVKVEAAKAPESAAQAGLGQAVDTRTYVIGAEDVLWISVWREPDFSGGKIVRPDGKITMPLIGDIEAAGLTPEKLGHTLTEALSEYINKPEITVSVNQINSQKYFITGNVNRVGQFPMVVPTRVADALSAAGGFRDFANTKKIVILRKDKPIYFNWQDYIKGKKPEQNIFLENGDKILVN